MEHRLTPLTGRPMQTRLKSGRATSMMSTCLVRMDPSLTSSRTPRGSRSGRAAVTRDVPVAPHDGSATATYSYSSGAQSLVLSGTGAYIGIPKAINGAEIESPDPGA